MSALPTTNATITVQRGTYNSGTKQTSSRANVDGLVGILVWIRDISLTLALGGNAPMFDAKMLWDADAYQIFDNDYITGYNPNGEPVAPLWLVQHAADRHPVAGVHYGVCLLKVVKGPGGT